MAREIVALRGEDARDRKYLSELTKRVSTALRAMQNSGDARKLTDSHSNVFWERIG